MSIQQLERFKILVVGDNCDDTYVYGTVDRLSPETPVPVLKQTKIVTKNGMVGNVVDNLKQLGCNVDMCSNCPSQIQKTRYVDERSGYHLLRVDSETTVDSWDMETPDPIDTYDAIVISDYNKGFVDYRHIEDLRETFSGPMFLDTKKTDLAAFDGIFVKINELEYNRSNSINDQLIVTLGSRGAMYKTKHETYFSAPKVEVFDVCGAGDTFLSALTYRYLQTQDVSNSIEFAIKASSITVTHNGNYAPTLEEIYAA